MRGLLLLLLATFLFDHSCDCRGQETQPASTIQTPSALDRVIALHDWMGLERALAGQGDAGPAFYRGVLLNHRGQYADSLKLLEPLVADAASGSDRMREKYARMALADDYFRTFRYKQAAEEYAALEKCCATQLDTRDHENTDLAASILPLLAGAPAQTLELSDGFTVPLDDNGTGGRIVEVYVDGHPTHWLFDPAANFTWLSQARAKQAGLKVLGNGELKVRGLGGGAIKVQAAVIPQLKLGNAIFHNVPAVIYADDGKYVYPFDGVLAQPLLAALGIVSASDDDHLTVLREATLSGGAPLFADGDSLLAGAGAKGEEQLYVIDPARASSRLDGRHLPTHAAELAGLGAGLGADSPGSAKAWSIETLTLDFGDTPAVFRELPVAAQGDGFSYGVLSEDALDQLETYTFDFRSMRFLVRVHEGR